MTVIPSSAALDPESDRGGRASQHPSSSPDGAFSVLAIDDNPSDLEILRRLIRKIPEWDVELTTCTEAMEGLAILEQRAVDVVLVDYRLGAINGIQLLEVIRRTGFRGSIVVLTGQGDERLAAEAMRAGAADYMPKSDLTVASLRRAIDHALDRGRLQVALTEHRERLEQANQDLQQKNQEIQSFYHTLSHELKTPLTAAREFVSILLDGLAGKLSPTQIEYLRYVKEGCDQMTTCLNDILDVTRMETGRLSMAPSTQSVVALVQRVAVGFGIRAKAAGVELVQHVAADLPDAAIDPHRITQVVSNLVDNSLKFTPPGGQVAIDVATSASGAIRVTVSDTGKGIGPEHLANIFERLYQVRDGSEQSRMGLGLGLFICREIVRLHGGDLSVTSEVGKGTTFTFDLPVASLQSTPASEGILQSHG